MNTIEYIDLCKEKLGLSSDYALAKSTGISRTTISGYRMRGGQMDTLACFKVADILGLPRDRVIADIELERAEKAGKSDQAHAWRDWLDKLGGVAAAFLLGTVLTAPSPAQASMKTESSSSGHCVLCQTEPRGKRRRKDKEKRASWLDPLAFLGFGPALAV